MYCTPRGRKVCVQNYVLHTQRKESLCAELCIVHPEEKSLCVELCIAHPEEGKSVCRTMYCTPRGKMSVCRTMYCTPRGRKVCVQNYVLHTQRKENTLRTTKRAYIFITFTTKIIEHSFFYICYFHKVLHTS